MKKYSKYIFTTLIIIFIVSIIIIKNLSANYISDAISEKTNGKIRLINTSGSLWKGKGYLAIAYGASDANPKVLDGIFSWDVTTKIFSPSKSKIFFHHQDINSGMGVNVYPIAQTSEAIKFEMPVEVLQGLSGVFSTLELIGKMNISIPALNWKNLQGKVLVDMNNIYSRKIPERELGSYTTSIDLQKNYPFIIQTKAGILNIDANGNLQPFSAQGEIKAHEYYQRELMPLLMMIGRVNNNKVEINL